LTESDEAAMDVKIRTAGLCLAIVALAIAVPPVEAAPKKKPVVYTTQPDPPITRPRARVTVAPRSFLDAGTEVLPGDRKFTDYAFPVGTYSTPLSVVQNTGGRVGWHRSPLPGPFDLPSRHNPFGW
jgi:hypothetical protein